MEKDFSRLLYDKYFGLTNRNLEVKMKNGAVAEGIIIGFYKGENNGNEPYITRWHIAHKKDENILEITPFGFFGGQIIEQKDIAEVRFFEDNTILRFR